MFFVRNNEKTFQKIAKTFKKLLTNILELANIKLHLL